MEALREELTVLVVDPEEWVAHEQQRLQREREQLGHLSELVAQLVIAGNEHGKALRRLIADEDRHERELAEARAGIADVRRVVAGLAEQLKVLQPEAAMKLYDSFEDTVELIENRLELIEHALPVIEKKVGLRRRPEKWGQQPDS